MIDKSLKSLIHEGYTYGRKKTDKNKIYWRCKHSTALSCGATASTNMSKECVRIIKPHSHQPFIRPTTWQKPKPKNVVCEICNERFYAKNLLLKHQLKHTDINLYECPVCNIKFLLKESCENHSKLHTDLEKFSCSFCEKRFLNKSDCKIHESTHTGEKPYKCSLCDSAFKSQGSLTHHKRKHHTNQHEINNTPVKDDQGLQNDFPQNHPIFYDSYGQPTSSIKDCDMERECLDIIKEIPEDNVGILENVVDNYDEPGTEAGQPTGMSLYSYCHSAFGLSSVYIL